MVQAKNLIKNPAVNISCGSLAGQTAIFSFTLCQGKKRYTYVGISVHSTTQFRVAVDWC